MAYEQSYTPYMITSPYYFFFIMATLQNEIILENIYDEVVEESINNLIKLGFKGITEEDLDQELLSQTVYKRFEDLCQ